MNRRSELRFPRHGSGRPVYFLHGFFSDARQWERLIATWHKQAMFTAVTPDLPGHGTAAGWRGDWGRHGLCIWIKTGYKFEGEWLRRGFG